MQSQPEGVKPAPLTRTRRDGTTYTRRPEIEEALGRLLSSSRQEVLAALAVRDSNSPDYIQSECIVHLIRRTRYDNDGAYFERLYRELIRRLDAAAPRLRGERLGETENVHWANARDALRDAFNERLATDKREPGPGLDYFEVMFADAVAALRSSALRKTGREAARTEAIERNPDTNEPSLAVELARGSLDVVAELMSDDPIYRSRVAAAIDALPDKQRRVIEMILSEMPMDAIDENAPSIRKALGVVEKTVRNRRDAAIANIRRALGMGPAQ